MQLLILLFTTVLYVQSSGPIVNTKQGPIEGVVHSSPRFTCDTFLGVPFALPPIGERRFKKPFPVPVKMDSTYKADHMGDRCMQSIEGRPEIYEIKLPESEDCLYLNIIKPSNVSSDTLLPVMVFIHGGGFVGGSAIEEGVDGPCNNIVSKEVILVIIQYRLGLFGFLSTGDATATGNWGLWDQIEALKWVQQNIINFGGDPNSVTIFGESAGGFSVSILSYSDITQDLYHRSIQQSGSTLTTLLLSESLADCTKFVAEYACSLKDPTSEEILKCLSSIPAKELLELDYDLNQKALKGELDKTLPAGFVSLSWVPVVDGDIIKYNGFDIHKAANSKPAIIGSNEFEMGWLVQPIPCIADVIAMFPTVLNEDQVTPDHFKGMVKTFIPPSTDADKVEAVQTAANLVYIDGVGAEGNKTLLLEQYIKLMSDIWFNIPSVLDAKARKAAGAKVFMYNFDYYCKNIFPEEHKFKSSQHGFELLHLFEMEFNKLNCGQYDDNDRKVGDTIAKLFTNFAKTGNPNPVVPEWPEWISTEKAFNYRIGLEPRVDDTYNTDRVVFWTKTVPNILNKHHEEL